MNKNRARVLIADDHAMIRRGLAMIINAEEDMSAVAEIGESTELIELLRSDVDFNVLLFDILMNNSQGMEMLKKALAIRPELHILVVSMQDERIYTEPVIHAGAKGFVAKRSSCKELTMAIRLVMSGNIYISQSMTTHLAYRKFARRSTDFTNQPINRLTNTEIEILRLVASGMNTHEIAALRFRSIKTVESHKSNIRVKLELKNAADIVRCAVRHFPPLGF